jgi:hypothetical protein
MDYLDWDSVGKMFWLLDTFDGIDMSLLDPEERAVAERMDAKLGDYYVHGADSVRANFSEWRNVRFIVGSVPGTLSQLDADPIAYLHLDMNSSPPEVAAIDALWDRLATGAPVLLDDYGFGGGACRRRRWMVGLSPAGSRSPRSQPAKV